MRRLVLDLIFLLGVRSLALSSHFSNVDVPDQGNLKGFPVDKWTVNIAADSVKRSIVTSNGQWKFRHWWFYECALVYKYVFYTFFLEFIM